MKKEEQASLVHDLGFGKRQRQAHKTGQTLPQGVIPTLDVGGFSALFSHGCMLLLWDHRLVSRPKVCETMPLTVSLWNGLPQPLTRLFTPISHGIGDHLTRLTTQSDPNPGVIGFFEHKRPELIEFQRGGSGILWVGGHQGGP